LSSFVGDQPYSVFFATVSAQEGLFEEPTRKAFVAVGRQVLEASEADGLWLIQDKASQAILHDAKPAYKRIGERIEAPRFDS
jgi:hypothetical protein